MRRIRVKHAAEVVQVIAFHIGDRVELRYCPTTAVDPRTWAMLVAGLPSSREVSR